MKKFIAALFAGGLTLACNVAIADGHEGDDDGPGVGAVEIYACSYNEGKGRADLEEAIDTFNDWADDEDIDDYLAWILSPFYSGPDQQFDYLWLGAASNGNSMGQTQDKWIATGGDSAAEFAEVGPCGAHGGFAVMQFKAPPERDNSEQLVMSFADCNFAEGKGYDDIADAMKTWGELREAQGSTSGLWALFPAYGDGTAAYDFKVLGAWQNFADMGTDFDGYGELSDKAAELFGGKVSCDEARVYVGTRARAATAE